MRLVSFIVAVAFMMPMIGNAQQGVNDRPTPIKAAEANRAAKLLRQHNVMVDFCGCCEKASPVYVKIKKVTVGESTIRVLGSDIETGKPYDKEVDVARTWVPIVMKGELKQMSCIGQMSGVKCDPCTTLSTPRGDIGAKIKEIEKDGLLEASDEVDKVDNKVSRNPNKPSRLDSEPVLRNPKGNLNNSRTKPEFKREGPQEKRINNNNPKPLSE